MAIDKLMNMHSSTKAESLVKQYLVCLVRRINKHLTKTQTEEYLAGWGGKVEHMRNETMRLIGLVTKRVQLNLRKLWADVETFVVKDATVVSRIYD